VKQEGKIVLEKGFQWWSAMNMTMLMKKHLNSLRSKLIHQLLQPHLGTKETGHQTVYFIPQYTDFITANCTFSTSYGIKFTRKCNLIYAHKNTIVFSVLIFFKLTNAQQHYVRISYEISMRLDSPSVKWFSLNEFSTHFLYQILPKICARYN
jgi:hypothetical protein